MTERKRRPHYQERRAHAEGWGIEVYDHHDKVWRSCECPRWLTDNGTYRIVPDADGWLPWYGSEDGKGPFEGNPMVEYKTRKYTPTARPQNELVWTYQQWDSDIVLYCRCPHQEPAEKPKVKMWQWIYRDTKQGVHLTDFFFDKPPVMGYREVIGPAPWTEIEI